MSKPRLFWTMGSNGKICICGTKYKYNNHVYSKIYTHRNQPCIYSKVEDKYIPIRKLQTGGGPSTCVPFLLPGIWSKTPDGILKTICDIIEKNQYKEYTVLNKLKILNVFQTIGVSNANTMASTKAFLKRELLALVDRNFDFVNIDRLYIVNAESPKNATLNITLDRETIDNIVDQIYTFVSAFPNHPTRKTLEQSGTFTYSLRPRDSYRAETLHKYLRDEFSFQVEEYFDFIKDLIIHRLDIEDTLLTFLKSKHGKVKKEQPKIYSYWEDDSKPALSEDEEDKELVYAVLQYIYRSPTMDSTSSEFEHYLSKMDRIHGLCVALKTKSNWKKYDAEEIADMVTDEPDY